MFAPLCYFRWRLCYFLEHRGLRRSGDRLPLRRQPARTLAPRLGRGRCASSCRASARPRRPRRSSRAGRAPWSCPGAGPRGRLIRLSVPDDELLEESSERSDPSNDSSSEVRRWPSPGTLPVLSQSSAVDRGRSDAFWWPLTAQKALAPLSVSCRSSNSCATPRSASRTGFRRLRSPAGAGRSHHCLASSSTRIDGNNGRTRTRYSRNRDFQSSYRWLREIQRGKSSGARAAAMSTLSFSGPENSGQPASFLLGRVSEIVLHHVGRPVVMTPPSDRGPPSPEHGIVNHLDRGGLGRSRDPGPSHRE